MKLPTLLFAPVFALAACSSGSDNTPTNAGETTATITHDLPSGGVDANMPDPQVQNTTHVSFEITVPAYQSNELQLRLSWGDFSTSLSWVGDEYWSTNAELPSNTERLLSIVFYDENGVIELGSFEQQYKTGTNAAELFQVTADQFDTDRWDFDEDGISNLDELIAGTDPRVNEDSLLRINDNQRMSLLFIANYFESQMRNERPYMGTEENILNERSGMTTTANIDADGNGSMSINTLPFARYNTRRGERLVLDNSVQWSGSWGYSDDYFLNQTFTSEVSVDGDTYRLVEEGKGSWIGTYSHRWETTVDVTGQLVEGTSYCKVVSGAITESYNNYQDGPDSTTLTITRDSIDDLWRVTDDSDYNGNMFTSQYFARELSMHMIRFAYQLPVSQNDYFYCDYAEL